MKKIAFSGTLDPITNGHMWVIGEARALADHVVVLISENPFKAPQFPAAKRQRIVEQSLAERGWDDVSVMIVRGDYTARAAKRHGIDYLIRGIRNTSDFDYENLLQQANVDVLQGAKTLFVMPPRDLGSVSSTFVRGLQGPVGWHWTMKKFVPRPAYEAWILDWLHKEWQSLFARTAQSPEAVANVDYWFAHLTGPAAYGNQARAYHNLDHLVHGLTEIAVWAANTGADADSVALLKKAFWFHDAVYATQPGEVSNEEASAALWVSSGLDAANATSVVALIRATDHAQRGAIDHPLAAAMIGADLAILGAAPENYDAYAQSVRQEYSWMPEAEYRAGRQAVLTHFDQAALNGKLFADPYFADLYQEAARENLAEEISGLSVC
jgi:pantetheine-phosphate adenylyltransferase